MKSAMKRSILLAGILVLTSLPLYVYAGGNTKSSPRATADMSARQAVDALNQKEVDACMKMDNTASAALWADDGVDLIQGLEPMIGKEAISKWYDSLTPQLQGAKVEYCTIEWKSIKIQGDWAWEWGINRQKIDFPPPQKSFESEGKILLILKRQPNGEWRIELESWNSSPQAKDEK